uniref:RNA 2',3'-cyclic phosphodiesterase n=1 Tax=Dictyoglomus thermophilum TaxID=14 RepID=A0A7C3RM32_DICTH
MAKKSSKDISYKRLFIAIDFPEDLKEKIFVFQKSVRNSIIGNVKWVEKENFHLTLRFIGEVSEKYVDEIKEVLDEVSHYVESFSITLEGFGGFPSLSSPRVLWIGIKDGLGNLEKIFDLIERRLVKKGIPKEKKPFSPHLTLGRVKENIRILQDFDFKKEEILVEEIVLFESTLTPQGPIYQPIYKVTLKKHI